MGIAQYFDHVEATDISENQLENAIKHPKVSYSSQAAELSNLGAGSVDLIIAAQALHWFDFDKFWLEAIRVAKKNAFFCAWGYAWMNIPNQHLIETLITPSKEALLEYWAPNNKILWNGYGPKEIQFPLRPVSVPNFQINLNWTISQIIQYMQTWSAYKIAIQNTASQIKLQKIFDKARLSDVYDNTYSVKMEILSIAGYF